MQREENDGAVYCRLTGNIQPRRIHELQRKKTYRCSSSLKIRSQYDNCRACATEQSLTNFRIMTARQIIYSSTIIVLGFFQALPALLCLASTNIPVILLGIIWGVLLGKFWSSTIIGKWYFRELWRATLRLENLMFPEV